MNDGNTVTLINCDFTGNVAGASGGGAAVFNGEDTICQILSCDFSQNFAANSAAIYHREGEMLTLTDSMRLDPNPDPRRG